jgi:arginyl-tRNA synthetase
MARRKLEEIVSRSILNVYGEHHRISIKPLDRFVTLSKLHNIDYQSNICFRIGKIVGDSPLKIATKIVQDVQKAQVVQEATVSSPGFINIRLCDHFVVEKLRATLENLDDEKTFVRKNKLHVLVDFSSPNIGKELHAGHMRSIFCGDTLANIFEFQGHKVDRVSHVGDFGLPVVMLIQHCWNTKHKLSWLENKGEVMSSLETLGKLYIKANNKMKCNRNKEIIFQNQVRHTLSILHRVQRGGVINRERVLSNLKESILDASIKRHQSLYSRLNISVVDKPESTYTKFFIPLMKELKKKRMVFRSNGALCIDANINYGSAPPVLVRKSDGSYLYASADLAAARFRLADESYDKVIYVTDVGQNLHFQQIFSIASLAGWVKSPAITNQQKNSPILSHVSHGVICGYGGKKLSSRNGESSFEKLLDSAVKNASFVLSKKHSTVPENCEKNLAEVIGIDGIRFYDLCAGNRSYTIDYSNMLNFKGNTSVYLQYTYSRFYSICDSSSLKHQFDWDHLCQLQSFNVNSDVERDLLFHLSRFDEALTITTETLAPNLLCEYVIDIARRANMFYETSRILGSKEEESRLQICYAILQIMECTMHLLGIKVVKRL